MTYQTDNTLEKREARVAAAMAFEEGDRVPIAPRVSSPYAQAAGLDFYEAWNDFRLMKPGVEKFLAFCFGFGFCRGFVCSGVFCRFRLLGIKCGNRNRKKQYCRLRVFHGVW